MAKNWKEFIEQPATKSASSKEQEAAKAMFDFNKKIREAKDITALAETNDSIKDLLKERDELEQKMQQLTGKKKETTKNTRVYDYAIPTFKERKAKEKEWLKKKEQGLRHKLAATSERSHWAKRQAKLKKQAIEKLKKNKLATTIKRSKREIDKGLSIIDKKEKRFLDKVKKVQDKTKNIQKKTDSWADKRDELMNKSSKVVRQIDNVYEELDKKRANIKKQTGFDVGENLPFDDLKKTTNLSNQLDEIKSVLKTDLLEDKLQQIKEKRQDILSTKKKLEKKGKETFQVDDIKKVIQKKKKIEKVVKNALEVGEVIQKKKKKGFDLNDVDRMLSKNELLKKKKQELQRKAKKEQEKWEKNRDEKRREERAKRRKKKEDKFHSLNV